MVIRIIKFLFFLVCVADGSSQSITDTTFKNVVKITNDNIVSNGVDYLFDVSINETLETPVIFIQPEVPSSLLSSVYPEFLKIIVISPNWKYYEEVSNWTSLSGITCAESMASFIIYEFNRKNGEIKKDSLVLMGRSPHMEYVQKSKIEKDKIEVYFQESYGSICCPVDQQWNNKPTREEFISLFEQENKIKIIDTYQEIAGKEGESNYHYTLNSLSNKLKLHFILEREFYRIINRQLKDIVNIPEIYTPRIVRINARMRKI